MLLEGHTYSFDFSAN